MWHILNVEKIAKLVGIIKISSKNPMSRKLQRSMKFQTASNESKRKFIGTARVSVDEALHPRLAQGMACNKAKQTTRARTHRVGEMRPSLHVSYYYML